MNRVKFDREPQELRVSEGDRGVRELVSFYNNFRFYIVVHFRNGEHQAEIV